MSKMNENFKNYYKFPLKTYNFDLDYAWTQDIKMAFNYIRKTRSEEDAFKDRDRIVSIINGDIKGDYTDVTIDKVNPCIIKINGEDAILMRGWGMLKGTHQLSSQIAAEVQDEFRDYIISKLLGE